MIFEAKPGNEKDHYYFYYIGKTEEGIHRCPLKKRSGKFRYIHSICFLIKLQGFILQLHFKRDFWHKVISFEFAKYSEHLFQGTPPGDCLRRYVQT